MSEAIVVDGWPYQPIFDEYYSCGNHLYINPDHTTTKRVDHVSGLVTVTYFSDKSFESDGVMSYSATVIFRSMLNRQSEFTFRFSDLYKGHGNDLILRLANAGLYINPIMINELTCYLAKACMLKAIEKDEHSLAPTLALPNV